MNSTENLFTISEIAKALRVTRRIILHYEERGLVQPDARDAATGNRLYSIDTFTQLRSIRSLQNLGLTLDEIRHPQDTAHARIYDRLLEMCVPISCIGVSLRRETAQEKLKRLKALIG